MQPCRLNAANATLLVRWLTYVFGGFGSLLFTASVLCFIAWYVRVQCSGVDTASERSFFDARRPLGDPAPAVANLALAIVILVVIVVQTAFNAWQGKSII